tara:strand:+ start:374 stop:496 length:123 start_codon:yes stop_codon:yes gene_type:complete
MNNKKRIEYAEKRIKELQDLIEHWKANDRKQQVPQEKPLS